MSSKSDARSPSGSRTTSGCRRRWSRAGHQRWSRGDLIAREFDDEHDEAAWICDRIEPMRGLAFNDTAESEPRGLSWSDFAVLFRSVAKDAGPVVEEMRRRDIPFIVKGLNRLFDSPEIQAVVGIFRFMADLASAADLRSALGRSQAHPGLRVLGGRARRTGEGRDFDRGERWGVYNIQRLYLEFLEALEMREDTLPGEPVRRELVFYQLGKFSQVISDFEQIYFTTEPRSKYEAFADVARAPGARLLRGRRRRRRLRDTRRRDAHDRPPGQGPAVAGGLPAGLRKNRFPAKRQGGLGLFHVIPEIAIDDPDRYRGTVDDETRLFYVAVTRAQKYLFVSFAPGSNQLYRRRSAFFDHFAAQQWVSTEIRASIGCAAARSTVPARDAPRHAVVLRAEVPLRVPLPVQAALPLRVQPADPRGARLRQGPARRARRDPQAGARRRHGFQGRG